MRHGDLDTVMWGNTKAIFQQQRIFQELRSFGIPSIGGEMFGGNGDIGLRVIQPMVPLWSSKTKRKE